MINKKYFLETVLILVILILTACAPGATPSPTATPTPEAFGLDTFVEALRASGANTQIAEEIEQPFFDAPGQVLVVNGMRVQVFEYPNQLAREEDSNRIAPDGRAIGGNIPEWTNQPHFWVRGRIIVLFIGTDQGTIRLLKDVLGEAITTHTIDRGPSPPLAATQAEIALSERLDLPREDILIADWEPVNWPDACLGLAQPDELCAQVISPGYRVTLEAQGQQYIAHTDQNGQQIRFENRPLTP